MAKLLFIFGALLAAAAAQDGGMALFDWDCSSGRGSLQSCNNACYVVNCVPGFDATTVYHLDRTNTNAHRTESGARPSPDPCKDSWGGSKQWRQAGDATSGGAPATSPDEFPWASVANGGAGARLRCVNPSDNTSKSSYHSLSIGICAAKANISDSGGGTKLRNFIATQPGWSGDPQGDNSLSRSFQVVISNPGNA